MRSNFLRRILIISLHCDRLALALDLYHYFLLFFPPCFSHFFLSFPCCLCFSSLILGFYFPLFFKTHSRCPVRSLPLSHVDSALHHPTIHLPRWARWDSREWSRGQRSQEAGGYCSPLCRWMLEGVFTCNFSWRSEGPLCITLLIIQESIFLAVLNFGLCFFFHLDMWLHCQCLSNVFYIGKDMRREHVHVSSWLLNVCGN